MITANYNGILTSNFLLEAGYSSRDLIFQNSGGSHLVTDYTDPRDIALGSLGYDWSYYGTVLRRRWAQSQRRRGPSCIVPSAASEVMRRLRHHSLVCLSARMH